VKKLCLFLLLIVAMPVCAQQRVTATLTASSTDCTTAASCIVNFVNNNSGGATFAISTNASASTVQFEASADNQTTWVAISATPSNSSSAVTSTTSTGVWQANVSGYSHVRMRVSAFVGNVVGSIGMGIGSAKGGSGSQGGSGLFSGPNPWVDCSSSPYSAPSTLGASTPTVDAGVALRACVAALPSSGGTIHLNPGRYGISTAATDSQGATVGINLAAKDGVRFECGGTGGIHQSGTNAYPCSIELISGIPAGTIIVETSPYTGSGASYAGPIFDNISFHDNTATGVGVAVKDTSDTQFNGVSVNGFSYAGLSAPASPTVTATAGGSLGAGVQVFVKVAHRTGWGFSLPSAEASATTAGTCPGSGNCSITITAPSNPGAPAIDWMPYASTTTLLEKSQIACCTGQAYGANYVISAALPGTGLREEVSNKTRGTGIAFYGSSGWGSSTGFVNHSLVTDLRAGQDNEIAFSTAGSTTSLTFIGGDIICQSTTSALPCSIVGSNVFFYGTHWESLAGRIGLQIEQIAPNGTRGTGVYGGLFEASGTGTGINCIRCFGDRFETTMASLTSGIILDANSGENQIWIQDVNVGTPVNEGAPGNNIFCDNAACTMLVNSLKVGPVGGPAKLLCSQTAPTITTHFNTSADSISSNNGNCSFTVTVGTGTGTSTGVVGLPTASTGWNCTAPNRNRGAFIQQTASATTSATFTNYGTTVGTPVNWTNSDVLGITCSAY